MNSFKASAVIIYFTALIMVYCSFCQRNDIAPGRGLSIHLTKCKGVRTLHSQGIQHIAQDEAAAATAATAPEPEVPQNIPVSYCTAVFILLFDLNNCRCDPTPPSPMHHRVRCPLTLVDALAAELVSQLDIAMIYPSPRLRFSRLSTNPSQIWYPLPPWVRPNNPLVHGSKQNPMRRDITRFFLIAPPTTRGINFPG